jgi:hypothetical protein
VQAGALLYRRALAIQPARHGVQARQMVGAKRTIRRHQGLHEDSISVGARCVGGGSPGRVSRQAAEGVVQQRET